MSLSVLVVTGNNMSLSVLVVTGNNMSLSVLVVTGNNMSIILQYLKMPMTRFLKKLLFVK